MDFQEIANIFSRKPNAKLVILTGAGISAESGIKTFRDNNGLWEDHSVEEVATPEGFARKPKLVYRFYNQRRKQLLSTQTQANKAHLALAKLERSIKDKVWIVTQNVDDLHERAGSEQVIHMHGSLVSAKCTMSNQAIRWTTNLDESSRCTCCSPEQPMRPDIVWFNEIPYHMEQIESLLYDCDLFVSIGTSGNVYPAAGFVNFASQCGAYTLELNLDASEGSQLFDDSYQGLASYLVPRFVDIVLDTIASSS